MRPPEPERPTVPEKPAVDTEDQEIEDLIGEPVEDDFDIQTFADDTASDEDGYDEEGEA